MIASMAVPEFRVSMKVNTDALDALYKRVKPKGVTMSALLAKAVGNALASHPLLYACTTADGAGIQYNDAINVAMAVAMPDGGLITPVLKRADATDLYSLSRTWGDLVKRARAKALSPDEYNSGTFTISNLGMFGVDTFGAILPPGTGAILAVGGSLPTVVADAEGRIAVRKVMTLNLTADHRHVYGADAAAFLQTLKGIIEDPEQLTL
jgi:pyruvate dehydrogenase E2 component (dihydrolipoamide acetyltransferase)